MVLETRRFLKMPLLSLLFMKKVDFSHLRIAVPLFFLVILIFNPRLFAQNGGRHVYTFLTLPESPRITALGGSGIALWGNDSGIAAQNPALYNAQMDKQLSISTLPYFAGIHSSNVSFTNHIDSLATFAVSARIVGYGTFAETDEYGQQIGEFGGNDYSLGIAAAKQWNRWSAGAKINFIYSHFAEYNSAGIAADLAASYIDTAKLFTATLLIQNAGVQVSTYADTRESLPFDIRMGISKRLKHLPFRLSLTAHHLHRWDIAYSDPNSIQTNIFGEIQDNEVGWVDNLFRHFILGGELFLGKPVSIAFGYNHLRRRELSIEGRRSLAGFSFGAGIHTRRLQIQYGMAIYHAIGGRHHLGINYSFKKSIPKANQ